MTKFAQGVYRVINPKKYVGSSPPQYRSSWENTFFRFLDTHPGILQWASESIRIPYRHPITGKLANYIPDLLIQYVDKNNSVKVELVEIKPAAQTSLTEARSKHDKIHAIINAAKWEAASRFCRAQGMIFRVVTERELFGGKYKRGR